MGKLRRFIQTALALAIAVSAFSIHITAENTSMVSEPVPAGTALNPVDAYKTVAENPHYRFDFDAKDGSIKIVDKDTGFQWTSSPVNYMKDSRAAGINKMEMGSQLAIQYFDKSNNVSEKVSKVGSVNEGGFSAKAIKNGVLALYNFPEQNILIPVEYTLVNDCFSAKVLLSDMKETGLFKISTISLLPYFGAGSNTDKGYMFVPDGCGAIINFNNSKSGIDGLADYDSQNVYGDDQAITVDSQNTVTQDIKMPVFGVKNNQDAFVAVIDSGASRCSVSASVCTKTSYNNIYSQFTYRNNVNVAVKSKSWDSTTIAMFEENVPQIQNYTVNYYLLQNNHANYTGMALRYQKYLQQQKGMKQTVSPNDYPLYVNLFGTVEKLDNVFGIPVNKMEPLTKYSDAVHIVKQLQNDGVKNIVIKYDAWMKGGVLNSIPVDLKAENALGGSSQLVQMANYMASNHVKTFLDVDITDMYKSRWGYNKTQDANKCIDKSPSIQYFFNADTYDINTDFPTSFLLKPTKVVSAAKQIADHLNKYNVAGVSLTSLGQKLYSDFPVKGEDRENVMRMWGQAIQDLKQGKQGILFDDANSYVFPYATNIISAPIESSKYSVEDYDVPFYQIVLHGLVSYSLPPVNLESNYKETILKALETGSSLNFVWAAQNTDKLANTPFNYLTGVLSSDWIQNAASSYRQASQILESVADKRIVDHKNLADGVAQTTYENGLKITVNYNNEPETVDGKTIAAKSYLIAR